MTRLALCLVILLLPFAAASCDRQQPEGIRNNTQATQGNVPDTTKPTSGHDDYAEDLSVPIPALNEYMVSLEINTDDRTVNGIQRVVFSNRTGEPLYDIVLRTFLNAFSEGFEPAPFFPEHETRVFRGGRSYGSIDVQYASIDNESLEFDHDGTVLILHLPLPLAPGDTVHLTIQFVAAMPSIAHLTGGNDNAMWFGMFLPHVAVFGEDGWHTEDFYPAGSPFILENASFNVEVWTPARYTVVGSGIRTEETIEDTNTKLTTFVAQQARDFAFAISDSFTHARISTASGVDIHFYYYTESLAPDDILGFARDLMEQFESRVGTFPFQHITIIEADLSFEGASLSQVVFMDPILPIQGNFRWLAHAIGNQWLKNIVGSNRILYPWLTEGLTRFASAALLYEAREELHEIMAEQYESVASYDDLHLTHSLDKFESWRHFAYTHGRKAQLMFYALYDLMGDDEFWHLISLYYHTFSFSMASGADFFMLAEEVFGESLDGFIADWFHSGNVPRLIER